MTQIYQKNLKEDDMILITRMAGFKRKAKPNIKKSGCVFAKNIFTGKSLSEAQYDDRLFIEFRVNYKFSTQIVLFLFLSFRTIYVSTQNICTELVVFMY